MARMIREEGILPERSEWFRASGIIGIRASVSQCANIVGFRSKTTGRPEGSGGRFRSGSYRMRVAGNIAALTPCRFNGHYFYSSLRAPQACTPAVEPQRASGRMSPLTRTPHRYCAEGRKSQQRSHVKPLYNRVITRTPVFSIGADGHYTMAKAHSLYFLRHFVTAKF